MGRCTARWLRFALLAAGTACGNGSAERAPGSSAGAAGSVGNVAGSGGTSAAGAAGMLASAGAGAASGAGVGGGSGGLAGSSGAAGEGGLSAGIGGAGPSAGTGGVAAELCPEAPTPRLASGTVLELPLKLTFDGTPLLFAEGNTVPGGGTLTPLGVRFYVSDIALLRNGGEPLPVDVVTSTGTVAPYGVHFFNADDDTSTTLRVLAPSGEYQGITFLWGLAQACNTRIPETSNAPLSPTSQMTWPHTGYLFFRYEGRTTFSGQGGAGAGGAGAGGAGAGGASAGGANAGGAGSGGAGAAGANAGGTGSGGAGAGGGAGNPSAAYPAVIHMGGSLFEPLAPVIRIDGALAVPATGPVQKGVRVALDEIFEGALADVDLTGFTGPPGEEVVRGERLRRSVPDLTVFSFEP